MTIIEIEGMEFYAFHGHYAEEQIVGNQFLVDLKLETEKEKANETDCIEDALNYQTAYKIVSKEMKANSALLENLADRILTSLCVSLPEIKKATIKVSKVNPPMGGKIQKVSVTQTRCN